MDSARANLASTFVNAFVNAGFGQDKLVTATSEDEKVGRGPPAGLPAWQAPRDATGVVQPPPEAPVPALPPPLPPLSHPPPTPRPAPQVHWIFKNKDHGKMSATASLGTVLLWDVEGGLPQIDRFLYSTDNQVRPSVPDWLAACLVQQRQPLTARRELGSCGP